MQDIGAWLTRTAWNEETKAPVELVTCEDGWVAVDMAANGAQSLAALVAKLSPRRLRDDVVAALTKAGLSCAPILTVNEVSQHRQTTERHLIVTGRRADGAEWPLLATPVRLSRTPGQVRRAIGALNGDVNEVLADWGVVRQPSPALADVP